MRTVTLLIRALLVFCVYSQSVHAEWGNCDVEINYDRAQTLRFSGLQSEVWPQPPLHEVTTKAAADIFRTSSTLRSHFTKVGRSSESFWLQGDTITYAFIQYYERECGSYFRGAAGIWQFMGSYRGSEGAWVSLWALKGHQGQWNHPVYLKGRGSFYRTNMRW